MSSEEDPRGAQHRRLGWTLGFLVFVDLAWFRLVSGGREPAMRFSPSPSAAWVFLGLLVALVVVMHGVLGARRAIREKGEFSYGDRDRRRLQWISATAIVPFVALRLAYGPLAMPLRGFDGLGLHQRMLEDLGRPILVVVQTLGVSSLGLHLFQGLAAHARRRGRPWLVPLGFLLAAVYVFVYVDALAVFVVGRPLVPRL